MGSRATEVGSPPAADTTPEDVAALYSWANLQGAKYRDYSASRREYRAQVRYRAAKALLERELQAQEEAEAAAVEAERIALAATYPPNDQNPAARIHSVRRAEAAARKATADRVEAARRAEAAAHAAVLALREQREISDAHSSAQRKAQVYEESQQRRRQLAGPQPRIGGANAPASTDSPSAAQAPQECLIEGELPGAHTPAPGASQPETSTDSPSISSLSGLLADWIDPLKLPAISADAPVPEAELNPTVPAWIHTAQTSLPFGTPTTTEASLTTSPMADTLLDSRERVASRWSALKDIIESPGPPPPFLQPQPPVRAHTQILAIFSLAGGVGKTSLAAALSRALSMQGEKVILADTTSHGLLPVYFGARQLPFGEVSVVPSSSAAESAQPLSLVAYDLAAEPQSAHDAVAETILRSAQGHHRLVLDLSSSSGWLLRRIADLYPTVLIPLTPDINSVVSLIALEGLFRGIADSTGRPVLPMYVVNQFDATQPLHLDVREVLSRQLADRLLPTVIRRSPAVSEALAHGTTVLDYAPDTPVSHDYLHLASWLKGSSPPITAEVCTGLRGEQ